MKVIATDERMVYLVTSETRPRAVPYRVDLLSHGGIGECACANFRTRVWPRIRDGLLTLDMPCEDKHIAAARGFFLRGLLAELARQETEPSCRV